MMAEIEYIIRLNREYEIKRHRVYNILDETD